MSLVLFGISVAVALVLTNIDNLAMLVALLLRLPKRRVLIAFIAAQVLVLVASKAIADGIELGFSAQAGWLGIIPILLGVRELLKRKNGDEPGVHDESTVLALTLVFLSISSDSLFVLTPLLADAAPGHRVFGILGAVFAWGALVVVGVKTARQAGVHSWWSKRFEQLAPWVMIAVGVYVLLDTATDMT
ncbi:cadmium resistance transporter [Shimia biformata]|uniref:cadmium resistance transporter n=1 Tax=Shimia biformata TaxID=1294299 RepID=UPI0019513B3E|nr:cadmium resistance transporter [Shimia biformata]